jgi:type II secretory pathway pseudopilin PulG
MIMKPNPKQKPKAFTRLELTVVVVVVLVLASMLLPPMNKVKAKAPRIDCVNNLKQIGIAYRLWSPDSTDRTPAQQSTSLGGWTELLTNADQGPNCWTNYAIMANELGLDPKLLVCPSDERRPAKDFKTDFKDNTHLSYFVGVSANDVYPDSIQTGDRNLGPGSVPDADYGYSPNNGKGNDVAVPISSPVSWSMKMHTVGTTVSAGNILLGDGSVQLVSSADLRTNWLTHADPTTTWPAGHTPSSPSIRLVFP